MLTVADRQPCGQHGLAGQQGQLDDKRPLRRCKSLHVDLNVPVEVETQGARVTRT
jgi:hypothetical protein